MLKKIILFIPFSVTENNFSLYIRAMEWRYNLKKDNMLEKVPDVVIYRSSDEQDEDYEDYDAQFHLTADNCPFNTTIYIMADGIGDPTLVGNINNYFHKLKETPYLLSVKAIASRLKNSGLNSELAKNLNSIKLFICEENNTNEQLTINFAHELGEDYNALTLHYYNAVLCIPHASEDKKVKKSGYIYSTKNGERQLIDSGLPSEYRFTLTVQEALQLEKTKMNFDVEQKANPMPSYEDNFTYLTIEEVEIDDEKVIPYLSSEIEFPDDEPAQDTYLTPPKETLQSQERQMIVYSSLSSVLFRNYTFFHPQSLEESYLHSAQTGNPSGITSSKCHQDRVGFHK